LSYLFTCLNQCRDVQTRRAAIQTIAFAREHAAFPVILRMDKAKHGEASYPQLINDAKNNGLKVMHIEVNFKAGVTLSHKDGGGA